MTCVRIRTNAISLPWDTFGKRSQLGIPRHGGSAPPARSPHRITSLYIGMVVNATGLAAESSVRLASWSPIEPNNRITTISIIVVTMRACRLQLSIPHDSYAVPLCSAPPPHCDNGPPKRGSRLRKVTGELVIQEPSIRLKLINEVAVVEPIERLQLGIPQPSPTTPPRSGPAA